MILSTLAIIICEIDSHAVGVRYFLRLLKSALENVSILVARIFVIENISFKIGPRLNNILCYGV